MAPDGELFIVDVIFENVGPGPAFVTKGLVSLRVATTAAFEIGPRIVATDRPVRANFRLAPATTGVDRAIATALSNRRTVTVGAVYHDIGAERGWQTRAHLTWNEAMGRWLLMNGQISSIELQLLI
jgi:hypothetical protein